MGRVTQRQVERNRASERFSIKDNVMGGDLFRLCEVAPGRLRVQIGSLFVRFPFAVSIATIIKEKLIQSEAVIDSGPVQTMADIAAVSMAIKHDITVERSPGIS